MKKILCILLLFPAILYSQAERFVINNGYVVLANGSAANPTYLVIHNGATNAITRNTGGIISEAEYNMIWWDIATNTGTYTVPFQYTTTNYLPLTFNIATAGIGGGTVKFSTYSDHGSVANCNGGTGIADNYCYKPSDVTNMNALNSISVYPGTASTDDSYYVVDRFWILDANTGYTTKPNPEITFSYINSSASSEIAAPNAFTETSLIAQRFNSALGTWGDWFGAAGTDAGMGTASTGPSPIGTANFFRSWTLSSSTNPLPIELTSFTVECDSAKALLKWTTATETNNSYYTIARSADGATFTTVAIVKGAGTSSTALNYSVTDYDPLPGTSYYRISQTDLDGHTTDLRVIPFSPCEGLPDAISAYNSNGIINININSPVSDTYFITLFNPIDQSLLSKTYRATRGNNSIKLQPQVADGVYLLNVKSSTVTYTKKMFLGR